MLKNPLYTLLIVMLLPLAGWSTHNRAGDITYEHLGGYTYRVTVTTCTFSEAPADRPELTEFEWGDGTRDTLVRSQIIQTAPDYQKNIYYGTHTYAGPGTYTIGMFDPNRNADIRNILNSVNQPFCIKSTIVISPVLGGNNSVQFQECPCPEIACLFKRYCYTMGAFDPDGDSISYELVVPYGDDCQQFALGIEYLYPDAPANMSNPFSGGGGTATLDPHTGVFCWDAPQIMGEFNFAIKVNEYRNGILIGWVIRDIQITVGNCNNNPPEIDPLPDTCVYAGNSVSFGVTAFDGDAGVSGLIEMNAYGGPFGVPNSPATYTDNSPNQSTLSGTFNWNTECSHVSNQSYIAYFEAVDNDQVVQLSDVKTASIRVVGPPPQNLTVSPAGSSMILNWDQYFCSDIIGYNIYRRVDSSAYTDTLCCQQGTPQAMGYQLIATINDWSTTQYIDNSGLVIGQNYCYLITAEFNPITESCVSEQACAELQFDVPVITNVSVITTDPANGSDSIVWAMPKELDTLGQFNGQYFYQVYRQMGTTNASTLIHTTPTSNSLALTDTAFVDNGLNTEGTPYTYRVELWYIDAITSNTELIGSTSNATSIFLNTLALDNRVELTWIDLTPWIDTLYEVYREDPGSPGVFNFIGTTTTEFYLDTGLVNGVEYCYRVRAIGYYSNPGVASPLYNWSQEVCAIPMDMEPPCPPVLTIASDCELGFNQLDWTNPNNFCADDAMSYTIYYAPTDTSDFSVLDVIDINTDTSYTHTMPNTVAGCYYVTATDSVQYGNESDSSNVICIDNCPYYWLPNIITPNNDGENDRFEPFPHRYVESVNMQIYNRWGELVFETTDPDVKWDGTSMTSGQDVSEGTYYYVCTVNTIRLQGIVPIMLKGHFTLSRGSRFSGN